MFFQKFDWDVYSIFSKIAAELKGFHTLLAINIWNIGQLAAAGHLARTPNKIDTRLQFHAAVNCFYLLGAKKKSKEFGLGMSLLYYRHINPFLLQYNPKNKWPQI